MMPVIRAPDCDTKARSPDQRRLVRKAGVDADAWQHQAEAIGTLDAQQVWPRGLQHRLLEVLANAGGNDDRGARLLCPRAVGSVQVPSGAV